MQASLSAPTAPPPASVLPYPPLPPGRSASSQPQPRKRRRRMRGSDYRSTPPWFCDAIGAQGAHLPSPPQFARSGSSLSNTRPGAPSSMQYNWGAWLVEILSRRAHWQPGALWERVGRSVALRAVERVATRNEEKDEAVRAAVRETVRVLVWNIIARESGVGSSHSLPAELQITARSATGDQSKILAGPESSVHRLTLAVIVRASLTMHQLDEMADEGHSARLESTCSASEAMCKYGDAVRERIAAAVVAKYSKRSSILWDFVSEMEKGMSSMRGSIDCGRDWDEFDSCCLLLAPSFVSFAEAVPLLEGFNPYGDHPFQQWILMLTQRTLASRWSSLLREIRAKWGLIVRNQERPDADADRAKLYIVVCEWVVKHALLRAAQGPESTASTPRSLSTASIRRLCQEQSGKSDTTVTVMPLIMVLVSLQELLECVERLQPWIDLNGLIRRNEDLTVYYNFVNAEWGCFSTLVDRVSVLAKMISTSSLSLTGDGVEGFRTSLVGLALEIGEVCCCAFGPGGSSFGARWAAVVEEALKQGFARASEPGPQAEIFSVGVWYQNLSSDRPCTVDSQWVRHYLGAHESVLRAFDLVCETSIWAPMESRLLLDGIIGIGDVTRLRYAQAGVMGYPLQWHREIRVCEMVRGAYGSDFHENVESVRTLISRLGTPLELFPRANVEECDERAVEMLKVHVDKGNPQAMEIYANILRGQGLFSYFAEKGFVKLDAQRATGLLKAASCQGSFRFASDIVKWVCSLKNPLPQNCVQELVSCLGKLSLSNAEAAKYRNLRNEITAGITPTPMRRPDLFVHFESLLRGGHRRF